MKLTSEVLNLAADKIEQHGWASGPGGWEGRDIETGGSAGLCLEGGILAAIGMTSQSACGAILLEQCPAARAVQAYLELPSDYELWEWNDISIRYSIDFPEGDERTGEQVVEVLRACALVEQARESSLEKVAA